MNSEPIKLLSEYIAKLNQDGTWFENSYQHVNDKIDINEVAQERTESNVRRNFQPN